MRTTRLYLHLVTATLAALILAAPVRAFADTYQVIVLQSDQAYFFDGMDDAGNVAIDFLADGYGACGFSECYNDYLNGSFTGQTPSSPAFTADDGTPCTPGVPAGGSVEHGVCSNGRDAFTGFLSSGQVIPNVYTGPLFQDLFLTGGEGPVYMNSLGDIVFDDHFSESWVEAIDLDTAPAPEPGSILLLGTGLLAGCVVVHRRRTQSCVSPV